MNGTSSKFKISTIIWGVLIIALITGYYLVKKGVILDKNNVYYAYYADVQGLQPSSPVNIKGVRVGKINDIDILANGKVKVEITISNKVQLHSGTIARLASGGVTGDKIIDIRPGDQPGILPDKAVLPTALDSSLLPVSVRFTPIFESAKYLLKSTDSVLQGLDFMISTGLISKAALKVIDFEQETKGLSRASSSLNQKAGNITNSINNMASKSSDLAAKKSSINNSINKIENKTAGLAAKNISGNVANIQASLKNLGKSFGTLDTSLTGLGRALNDKQQYNNSSTAFDTLTQNLHQLQKDPPGISIFGGKKKK